MEKKYLVMLQAFEESGDPHQPDVIIPHDCMLGVVVRRCECVLIH